MATQYERDLYTLRNAGFAVINNFLDSETLDTLDRLAWEFKAEIEEHESNGGSVLLKAGWPLSNARCLYAVHPAFQQLVLDPRLIQYANDYLLNPKLFDCHLLCNMPDPRNQERGADADVNYHRDNVWPEGPVKPMHLHAFLLLTEMTRENGGTIVVPGTHLGREPDYYFKNTDPGRQIESNFYPVYPRNYFPASVQLEAPRGSLVLFDPMCIHAQGINVSQHRRTVLNCTFVSEGVRGIINCRGVAESSARYAVREELLELLLLDPELPSQYGPLKVHS